jgi:hypothetical protein
MRFGKRHFSFGQGRHPIVVSGTLPTTGYAVSREILLENTSL